MKKVTYYLIAVIACIAYIVLSNILLALFGRSFGELGVIWKIILVIPVYGIWKLITRNINKEIEDNSDQKE